MEKLTGLKKIKTAVFISGAGSNLRNLIKFSKVKKTPISIDLIISSTAKAKGLRYGTQYKIKKKIFDFQNIKTEEKNILALLKKEKISFICLAGFMKILTKNFIKKFNGKIINIHPSLLPKYKGLNTHGRAIQNKDKFSLEFYFKDSGHAIITKNEEHTLNQPIKIKSREFGLKNLLRKIIKLI